MNSEPVPDNTNSQKKKNCSEGPGRRTTPNTRQRDKPPRTTSPNANLKRWYTDGRHFFLSQIEICHIKDCVARAETNRVDDASRKNKTTAQSWSTPAHSPTHLSDTTDSVSRSYWFATAREEVLPPLPPATLVQCATLAFLLHAVIAKGWHSPIGSRMQQVCSLFTWLETIGARYGPLRVLRPAGRDV